ncbi:VWA domain-containing protein, partial [Streptomyces sp. NPDC029554]|uniref:VWA domain-containing protein n=1 Tax=Streptomyces sp. NPDC029554 TaxID=3155126 RepID=UPI0033C6A50F
QTEAQAEAKAEAPVTEPEAETETETDKPAEAEPKPEPTEEPTPTEAPKTAEPQTEAQAEAKAEAPVTEPEAETETETDKPAEAESKPEATPEPAAEADETPEPVAADGDEAPQGPPAPDDETRTGADEAPEPAAADGDEAPQGPPAPDDESRTGGAGGDDTAEGEAETEAEAEQPGPEAKPALTLAQLKNAAPALATAYRAAATTLKTHSLTGTRAKVYLVLDRSASMRPYYKDGSAQALAEQTLALAAHLDPEATVPVVFFSTELDGTGELTLTDHEDKIDTLHASLGRMGRTSYHAAVEAVLAHHDKATADTPGLPALVVFQTDGAPDAKTPATQALTDAAKTHPAVFFSFVAFGDPENKAFDYLRKLKTPNTSHFLAGETPRELTDKELYEGVLANWRP